MAKWPGQMEEKEMRTLMIVALGILFILLAVLEVMTSRVNPDPGIPATPAMVHVRGVEDAPTWSGHAPAVRVAGVEMPD